jgi:phage gp37-like protein
MFNRFSVRKLVDGTYGIFDALYTINGKPAPYLCYTGIDTEERANEICSRYNEIKDERINDDDYI